VVIRPEAQLTMAALSRKHIEHIDRGVCVVLWM